MIFHQMKKSLMNKVDESLYLNITAAADFLIGEMFNVKEYSDSGNSNGSCSYSGKGNVTHNTGK